MFQADEAATVNRLLTESKCDLGITMETFLPNSLQNMIICVDTGVATGGIRGP